MKDELPNDTFIEACFLKAKAYCYNTVKGEDEKKLKGITKATIKTKLLLKTIKTLCMKLKINMLHDLLLIVRNTI